jgi:restriction endonuclease
MANVVIPSNPADIKKIKDAAREYSDAAIRIESEKDLMKEVVETLSEETDLPKSVIKKIFDMYAKDTFDKISQANEDVGTLYEAVFRANP